MHVAARKIARALFSIWFVVTIIFFLMRMSGDPALLILRSDEIPEEVLATFRAMWGIDRPVWDQYLTYVGNVFAGDFGRSFMDMRPALQVFLSRLPITLLLTFSALLVSLLLGFSSGIMAALNHNRSTDTAVSTAAILMHAMPSFVLGILLILIFSVKLRWLPAGGSGGWRHLILPAITYGAAGAAVIARFVRSSVLETLRQPFVVAARARGLPEARIIFRHVLPNAGLPLLTVLGFLVGALVSGSVVVETVFSWPGAGRLTATAVGVRDLPVVQVVVLFVMSAMVLTNLCIDMLYVVLDPRIRLSKPTGG